MTFKGSVAVLLAAWSSHVYADRVKLSDIIARPEKFDRREVTVIGLVAEGGNGLYLFPTFEAAAKGSRHTQGAVYVPGPFEHSFNRQDYTRHWIEVTGVVHAEWHGWAGENLCEIAMTHLRDLRGEKRVLWPQDIGSFLNATPTTIVLESEVSGGGSEGIVVKPYQSQTMIIIPSGTLEVSKPPAKAMFAVQLHYPKRRPRDPSERRFRFVVHEHRLEYVGEGRLRQRSP